MSVAEEFLDKAVSLNSRSRLTTHGDLVKAKQILIVENTEANRVRELSAHLPDWMAVVGFDAHALSKESIDWSPVYAKKVVFWPEEDDLTVTGFSEKIALSIGEDVEELKIVDANRPPPSENEKLLAWLGHGIKTWEYVEPANSSSKPVQHAAKCPEIAPVERSAPKPLAAEPATVRAASRVSELQIQRLRDEDGEGASRELRSRFAIDRTSVKPFLDEAAPKREFLIEGFLPARESGMIVGKGGVGKGHFQQHLAISIALGLDFGQYRVPIPRGVVLVSAEDDRSEMHRRFRDQLNLRLANDKTDWSQVLLDYRARLESNIRMVDVRGIVDFGLGEEMTHLIAGVCEQVENPGLVIFDPLARFLPEGAESGDLNSQEGAARIVSEMDRLRSETDCTILGVHHVNKFAQRAGAELDSSAATGSGQLTDLCRWQLNVAEVSDKERQDWSIDPGSYVQATLSKTNYTAKLETNVVFKRGKGGALTHAITRPRVDGDTEKVLVVIRETGEWVTLKDMKGALEDVGVNDKRTSAALKVLRAEGFVEMEKRRIKHAKSPVMHFAPARSTRPSDWPEPPGEPRDRKKTTDAVIPIQRNLGLTNAD